MLPGLVLFHHRILASHNNDDARIHCSKCLWIRQRYCSLLGQWALPTKCTHTEQKPRGSQLNGCNLYPCAFIPVPVHTLGWKLCPCVGGVSSFFFFLFIYSGIDCYCCMCVLRICSFVWTGSFSFSAQTSNIWNLVRFLGACACIQFIFHLNFECIAVRNYLRTKTKYI